MKRRALLGTLATTAFAGCTGVLGDSADTTDDPTTDDPPDSPTTTDPTTDKPFEYTLADVQTDDAPVDDVTIDVTLQQQFSTEHTAVLRVAFTNDADESRTFQFGSLVPWDGIRGEHADGTSSLLLAPGTSVVPDEPDGDCWRATDSLALPMVMKSETLEPGGTRSHDYRVLAKHGTDACHPSGTYRFEDEGYVGEGWGFDVEIDPALE